jgi:hypothetical protein
MPARLPLPHAGRAETAPAKRTSAAPQQELPNQK